MKNWIKIVNCNAPFISRSASLGYFAIIKFHEIIKKLPKVSSNTLILSLIRYMYFLFYSTSKYPINLSMTFQVSSTSASSSIFITKSAIYLVKKIVLSPNGRGFEIKDDVPGNFRLFLLPIARGGRFFENNPPQKYRVPNYL